MRIFTVLLSFGLLTFSIAAPAPQPKVPSFFFKDPLSIHRRSSIPLPVAGDDEQTKQSTKLLAYDLEVEFIEDSDPAHLTSSSSASTSSSSSKNVVVETEMEAYEVEETEAEDACANVCGVTRVEGAKSEHEALCSPAGLKATYACAQCIDNVWNDITWENSALAEYERIASACEGVNSSQNPIRRRNSLVSHSNTP
ncbi:uncharacterized protein IAS62_005055 [Cryptococcus decagattii]|uniref:Uncharacterized protein n=1 Tax=Cryptococcus decagattii TaxID=1859122 RepID=A0ABZ2B4Q4_9TREE